MKSPELPKSFSSPSEIIENVVITNNSIDDEGFFYHDGGVPLMNIVADGVDDTDELMAGVERAFSEMKKDN